MDVSSLWWSIGFAKVPKEPPYPRSGDACSWASEPEVEGGGSWHHVKDVESRFFFFCRRLLSFCFGGKGETRAVGGISQKNVCVLVGSQFNRAQSTSANQRSNRLFLYPSRLAARRGESDAKNWRSRRKGGSRRMQRRAVFVVMGTNSRARPGAHDTSLGRHWNLRSSALRERGRKRRGEWRCERRSSCCVKSFTRGCW